MLNLQNPQLHDISRHSLFSLLTVNRAFHDITLPVFYRSCVLHFSNQDRSGAARIESWLKESSAILSFIRNITIAGGQVGYYNPPRGIVLAPAAENTTKWNCVTQLLGKISRLASFTFDYPEQMPIILLDALHKHHPSAHLHIRNWRRSSTSNPVVEPAEEALAHSPCLRSLHGHFITGGPDADFRNEAFDRIAKLSPNLVAISRTSRAQGGCVHYFIGRAKIQKRARKAQKFAVKTPRRKAIKSLRMNFANADTLTDLGSYMDLGQLTSLGDIELTSDFFRLAVEDQTYKLSSLKHLDLNLTSRRSSRDYPATESAFTLFLAEGCGALKSLSIVIETSRPWGPILSTILLYQGFLLDKLSLHQVQGVKRACLTLDEVSEICHSCPGLSSLGLDIDRTVERKAESAYYAILCQFSNLRKLKIYMDSGMHPFAHKKFALEVWEGVSQRTGLTQTVRLRELILCIGEQDVTVFHGYPSPGARSLAASRERVRVKRSERDDRPAEVDVTITSVDNLLRGTAL
ncbi:hypothetical protein BT96DRAFT_994759 [Gymnopus androsaceus JB14]|uniref:Uncharacterized protein n=1 Tax=Gymnopus androsaceus JB14 TaxID=1447944 RepID=A0A6A4HNG1_9AGAR|nr:hypothetical protein BT96DRAFT_994759 [Gymnopus androsaceus JB14]